MALTTGESISDSLRFTVSAGSDAYLLDQEIRERALHFLIDVDAMAWTMAPWWFKQNDAQLTALANDGFALLPSDFGALGVEGDIYITGMHYPPLRYVPSADFEALRNAAVANITYPWNYTIKGRTSAALAKLLVYPINSIQLTFELKSYDRRRPEFVDFPVAPGVAINVAAGNLNGAYTYRCTFVTLDGETEGGSVSASVSPVNQQVNLTQIPTSPSHLVTSRKVYRTAAGGIQHKFVGTISDNLTTTFTDNLADGSLGVNAPTPSSGVVTGMEIYPEDFHEQVFVFGLNNRFRGASGDLREASYDQILETRIRRMWANHKQGQNTLQVMPAYGERVGFSQRRPRLM